MQCVLEYTSTLLPLLQKKQQLFYGAQARIEMTVLFLYSQTA